ncbi:hypothetical protein R3P38DRAFT_490171 [Favolaschia claudopus]|uniref:Uncharacterized protein n=1 Tax=Favolaschia claudopus TaxID=2862362 RepID=A0AAW0CKZ3_9AGAR
MALAYGHLSLDTYVILYRTRSVCFNQFAAAWRMWSRRIAKLPVSCEATQKTRVVCVNSARLGSLLTTSFHDCRLLVLSLRRMYHKSAHRTVFLCIAHMLLYATGLLRVPTRSSFHCHSLDRTPPLRRASAPYRQPGRQRNSPARDHTSSSPHPYLLRLGVAPAYRPSKRPEDRDRVWKQLPLTPLVCAHCMVLETAAMEVYHTSQTL